VLIFALFVGAALAGGKKKNHGYGKTGNKTPLGISGISETESNPLFLLVIKNV
jgi:hypothetical protein